MGDCEAKCPECGAKCGHWKGEGSHPPLGYGESAMWIHLEGVYYLVWMCSKDGSLRAEEVAVG